MPTTMKSKTEFFSATDEFSKNCEILDAMLFEAVTDNRDLRYDELTFVRTKFGFDDKQIYRELYRTRQRIRLQAIAGRANERQKAFSEREKLQKIAADELPQIDAELAKLQARRDSIEKNARLAEKRCTEISEAVEQLRNPEILRKDIATEYEHTQRQIAEEFSEIQTLNVEISFRENLLGQVPSDFNERQLFLGRIRSSYPDCVAYSEHKRGTLQLTSQWAERKAILAKELAEMESRRDMLVQERAKAIDEANKLLDFYLS
jgi:chromosome segregation ATPase